MTFSAWVTGMIPNNVFPTIVAGFSFRMRAARVSSAGSVNAKSEKSVELSLLPQDNQHLCSVSGESKNRTSCVHADVST